MTTHVIRPLFIAAAGACVYASCALSCRLKGKHGLGSRVSKFPSLYHAPSLWHILKTGQGPRGRSCGLNTLFATYDMDEGLILRPVMWMTEFAAHPVIHPPISITENGASFNRRSI